MMNKSIETVTRLEGRAMTVPEIAKKFEVDTDRYEIDKIETSQYQQAQKDPEGNPIIVELHRTLAKWVRKFPEEVDYTIDAIMKVIDQDMGGKGFAKKDYKIIKDNILGTLDLFDLHINKRDRENTPIKKKLKKYDKQIDTLVQRLKLFNVQNLAIILGGDLLETDHKGRTTSGTQVDAMLDEKDAFIESQERLLRTIEKLRQDFKVQLYFVLGNHDHNVLYYLSLVIAQAYKDTEVQVHTGADRHYIDRGKTAIQLLHGDEKNHLSIMVDEFLMKSRKSYDHIYSKGGHTHRNEVTMMGPMKSRTHASPSKKNKRASKYGYDPKPAMEATIYDKKEGEIIHLTSNSK